MYLHLHAAPQHVHERLPLQVLGEGRALHGVDVPRLDLGAVSVLGEFD